MMNSNNLLPSHGIAYLITSFFDFDDSNRLFNELRNEVPWKQEPVVIFGRKVMQPRLTAWVGDPGLRYRYSGIEMQALPWIPPLIEIRDRIEMALGTRFNSVLLNLYRDGKDSMGWHRDNEPELGPQPLIASVSFGETRRFLFRRYGNHINKREALLEAGSLLVMQGDCQTHWEHSIPKAMKVRGPRINLTFRKIIPGS